MTRFLVGLSGAQQAGFDCSLRGRCCVLSEEIAGNLAQIMDKRSKPLQLMWQAGGSAHMPL
jgi:hypothetical protein